MIEALRLWARLLYAPGRGLRLAAERRQLLGPIIFALLAQIAFALTFFGRYYIAAAVEAARVFPAYLDLFRNPAARWAVAVMASIIGAAVNTVLVGLVFVPVATFLSGRRTGDRTFSTSLQRHYVPTAAAVFSAFGLGYVWGLGVDLILRATGVIGALVQKLIPVLEQSAKEQPQMAAMVESMGREALASRILLEFFIVPGLIVALWWGVRIAFDASWARAFFSLAMAGLAALSIQSLFGAGLVSAMVAALMLGLMSFVVLRAYFLTAVERQRTALAFTEAVRAADTSPHDPHAQAELGALLMKRGDLGGARERFERAVDRDPNDWNSWYELGRLARREGRWADAIGQFGPVVVNSFDHAHYEIWREVGGTYLGADQFADAVEALEKFLDHRPHDAEGWCLLGQAQAGLGNQIEAAAAMHACVTAVEGLPEPDEHARGWRSRAENYLRSVGR